MDRVDTREHVLDFSKQTVITRDTVAISINALAYFVIRDPQLAVYKIDNLPYAIELLVQSTLRNLVAKITLDDTCSGALVGSQLLTLRTSSSRSSTSRPQAGGGTVHCLHSRRER